MLSVSRFPPPWTMEEHNNACFIVKDATGQAQRGSLAWISTAKDSPNGEVTKRFI
jgi:hypothetical protein